MPVTLEIPPPPPPENGSIQFNHLEVKCHLLLAAIRTEVRVESETMKMSLNLVKDFWWDVHFRAPETLRPYDGLFFALAQRIAGQPGFSEAFGRFVTIVGVLPLAALTAGTYDAMSPARREKN